MKSNFPDNWKYTKFQDVVYFQEGPGIRRHQYKDNGIPFLNIRCIKENGHIDLQSASYLNEKEVYEKYEHFLLNENDLIVSSSGTLGRIGVIKKENLPLMLNTSIIRMRPKNDKMISLFLKYYLESWLFKNYILREATGMAQLNYGPSHLKKLSIYLPPIVEQRGIIEVLGTVDECIRLTNEIIGRAEELKRGLMQRLLTRGIGHTEYKQTPLGDIPKTWNLEKIGKYVKLKNGFAFKSKDYVKKGIPLLRISNVSFGNISNDNIAFLPCEYLEKYSEFRLEKNDVVIALTRPITEGGIKAAKICDEFNPSLLNQRVGVFRLKRNNDLSIDYLYYNIFSDYFVKKIILGLLAMHQPNISTNTIEKIQIPLPPIEEQSKICKIISNYDKIINNEKMKLIYLNQIKKGLMQVLLSGKVRVELREDGLHRIGDS